MPADNADPDTTDQYTRLTKNAFKRGKIDEKYSRSCELAASAGMNLMQPYLDFTGDDPAQGELKLKIWEYNSFLVDPFFREPDMSDANLVWCQEYMRQNDAVERFGERVLEISPMGSNSGRQTKFYFLPEAQSLAAKNMYVVSYVWYKSRKMKKRLYSKKNDQFFDFSLKAGVIDQVLYAITDFEVVEVNVPCWKLCTVVNSQVVYNGGNPLGVDTKCPFIPNYWNYDPQINDYNLRSRSMIFPMRSPQFLFNHKIIQNNDIASATINSGYMRKVGAVANEENLRKVGQGYDIIINNGYELTDVQKIIPTAVPESDLMLAQQMSDLIFQTSGIQLENWAGQEDKQISTLTAVIKQAANLLVFQKYFDQWDLAYEYLSDLCLNIMLENWNEAKVSLIIGEEPSPHFYSGIFAKYQVTAEEGLDTPTQKNYQAQQLLEINERFGREIFPPSFIIKDMNLQGKAEAMQYLQQQEQAMQEAQAEQQNIAHAFEEVKLKELMTRAMNNLAMARERSSRADSNVGLFEERLSEISRNNSLAIKDKIEATEKLVDIIAKYGELEASLGMASIQQIGNQEEALQDKEKNQAQNTVVANDFKNRILSEQLDTGMSQQGVPNVTQN